MCGQFKNSIAAIAAVLHPAIYWMTLSFIISKHRRCNRSYIVKDCWEELYIHGILLKPVAEVATVTLARAAILFDNFLWFPQVPVARVLKLFMSHETQLVRRASVLNYYIQCVTANHCRPACLPVHCSIAVPATYTAAGRTCVYKLRLTSEWITTGCSSSSWLSSIVWEEERPAHYCHECTPLQRQRHVDIQHTGWTSLTMSRERERERETGRIGVGDSTRPDATSSRVLRRPFYSTNTCHESSSWQEFFCSY
jgi:hypothetical protein